MNSLVAHPCHLKGTMGAVPSQRRKFSYVFGRNRRNVFDVLVEQPVLAGVDDEGDMLMRFMMVVIPKGYETAAADALPSAAGVAKMMEYNKSLQRAGVLLGLDGLFPPLAGARVSYTDGKATVTDGPFAEAKEAIGGYWIIQVRSREEAVEWAKRAPMANNEIIEVRQIHEMGDFSVDVQRAAEGFEKLPNAAAARA